jgi:hypothetical protein
VSVPLVEDAPTEYDPNAILAAEDQVRDFCGWHVAPSRTETITLDGSGTAILLLPSTYVTAISSITENGVVVSSAYYSWSENGLVEKLYGAWTWKRRAIQVTLTHGYTTCPAAIRREVARLAAASYANPAPLDELSQLALRPYEIKNL